MEENKEDKEEGDIKQTKDLEEVKINTKVEKEIKPKLKTNPVKLDGDLYMFCCPHCQIMVTVLKKQLNCKIFRCGILKSNGKQINPHMKKENCDKLKSENKIYGCGKPFRFKDIYVEKCGYI